MKKLLILVLIGLLGFLCYNLIASGYQIAGVKILSLQEIQNENERLDTTIANIEKLKSVEYPTKLSDMNKAAKTMLSNKKTYEELATYSSEQDVKNATQTETYDIEVLWVRIGNHAEKNGVIPKLEVLSSSNNTNGANDLRITATGSYIGLTDFVRDIEDDSKLGFAIDNFELIPIPEENNSESKQDSQEETSNKGSILQASFKIKDIFINPDTITTTQSNIVEYESEKTTTNNTVTNTTNTITTNNTNSITTNTNANTN